MVTAYEGSCPLKVPKASLSNLDKSILFSGSLVLNSISIGDRCEPRVRNKVLIP